MEKFFCCNKLPAETAEIYKFVYIQYEATETNFIQPHFDAQKQDYSS